jgi:hypothetical protein
VSSSVRLIKKTRTSQQTERKGVANIMDKTFKVTDIQIGFHAEGYRIGKTASPMDFYTKW